MLALLTRYMHVSVSWISTHVTHDTKVLREPDAFWVRQGAQTCKWDVALLLWGLYNACVVFDCYFLQPPNYLIIVVNRFRYINNQFAKDKCSIPMDMTVVLGYHKFSLQATIDHHGPSIYSGHYTTSVNCCNRTFYCNDNKITEFDMINTKNSSTAYVVIYKLIT